MVTQSTPQTINDVFSQAAERFKDRANLLNHKSAGQWVPLSTAEVWQSVRDLALGFHCIGVRPGDHIALLSENRLEWTLADLALLAIGAVVVPIYSTQAAAQVEYILRDSASRMILISTDEQLSRIKSVLTRVESLKRIILFDPALGDGPTVHHLFDVQARGSRAASDRAQLYDQLRAAVRPEHLATLIYTSGTTGEPKGVMLTHGNIASNVVATMEVLGTASTDTVLSFLPFAHSFERTVFYCYLHGGATIYYAESLDALPQNLREVRPTIMVGVPRLFEKMYERVNAKIATKPPLVRQSLAWAVGVGKRYAKAVANKDPVGPLLNVSYQVARTIGLSKIKANLGLDRTRCLLSGGAALSPEIAFFFLGLGIEIIQGYGLTETSPVVTTNTPSANKIGTVGKPVPGVEVKIADDGEILVRGPNVMRGYYNLPEATQDALSTGGWLRTGDIGHIDEEGYLVITDRKKDLIKTSGGKYVAPQLIEGLIIASPLVAQVFVTGNDRKFPAALIVPNFDPLIAYARSQGIHFREETELIENPRIVELYQAEVDRLSEGLSPYERVKKLALLPQGFTIDSGQLTPTMKLRRRVIETTYQEVIDRLYTD
jgi:long-chain acyl-CoA synthetase